MRFSISQYIILLFLSLNSVILAQSSMDYIRVFGDSMILITQEDDYNIPFVHYVFLAQYYRNNAHGVRAGDITIRTDSAGILIENKIKYDHPLSYMSETPLLPYYVTGGGDSVANAIFSKSFILGEYDTLEFYREATTRWPAINENGTTFVFDTNTTAAMPDSCLFISELISEDGTTIIQALDTVVYKHSPPTQYVTDLVHYRCDSSDAYACFRIKTVLNNPLHIGHPIRMRIRPQFHFIESQSDTDRCILAQYHWSLSALSVYYQYFSGDTLDKRRDAEISAIRVNNMDIMPSSIHGLIAVNMTIYIPGANGPANLRIYDHSGRRLDSHTLSFNDGAAAFLFKSGNYTSGILHFIVVSDNIYHYSKISLVK